MTKKVIKKIFKIIGLILIIGLFGIIGFGFYLYKTNPIFNGIVNNDESKLFYFPSKKVLPFKDLQHSEKTLKVDDSINIYSYLFKTEQKAIAKIFFIHGGGGNVSTYQNMIKPLVDNGFEVYAFDWRGFGKSNGTPNYKGVLKDTEVSFTDFLNTKDDENEKVIIYGMSLGGQLAVKIARENQSKVDLLILDSSIESAQTLAMDYSPISYLKDKAKNSPQDFNQDYVAIQDIKYIENTPKLIIQGKNDKIVPEIRGKNLFESAKMPKTYWETNSDHIMTLVDSPKETITKIKEQLQ